MILRPQNLMTVPTFFICHALIHKRRDRAWVTLVSWVNVTASKMHFNLFPFFLSPTSKNFKMNSGRVFLFVRFNSIVLIAMLSSALELHAWCMFYKTAFKHSSLKGKSLIVSLKRLADAVKLFLLSWWFDTIDWLLDHRVFLLAIKVQ